MTVLLVAAGALIGAPLRYLTDRFVQSRHGSVFPWGTLTVNVAASLLLGGLVGAEANPTLTALVGTGFCGALSTYSTFSYETLTLARTGAYVYALANVAANVTTCLAAAYLGVLAGGTLLG